MRQGFVLVYYIFCVCAQYCIVCVFETSVLVHSASNHLRDRVFAYRFHILFWKDLLCPLLVLWRGLPPMCPSGWGGESGSITHPPWWSCLRRGYLNGQGPSLVSWTSAFHYLNTQHTRTHTHTTISTTNIPHVNWALHTNTPYEWRWCGPGP